MSDSVDWNLLARYLAGEASQPEKETVEAWLQAEPAHLDLGRELEKIWNVPEIDPGPVEVERLWLQTAEKAGIPLSSVPSRVDRESPVEPRIRRFRDLRYPPAFRFLPYAVAVLLFAIIPYFIWKGVSPAAEKIPADLRSLAVAHGQQADLTLSDGTRVRLDAGSTFKFPPDFKGRNREVYLSGEGYFEVQPDGGTSFIIHAHDAVIRVLGTRFNVRAWPRSRRVEVAVIQGSVSLSAARAEKAPGIHVSRGQLGVVSEGRPPTEPRAVETDRYLGWLKREAVFQDVPLGEILFQLERWYDVRFVLEDERIASERLTAYIENRPIDEILELISTLTDQDIESRGDVVTLTPRNR
jgi:ferric-dicitrate binding protein FerR (iron transport regulator)